METRRAYPFPEIEARWQRHWLENKTFRAADPGTPGSERPKYYILDMFPYPSGAGLHVGHPEGYTATDIIARYKRMRGFNVLHPMGWDAFGLPTERYAIQTGMHPRDATRRNIDTFRRQIRSLGFSYDWDREFSTTDPDYVRWTQWIFLQLYKQGLAYVADAPVWFCPALGTGLANEEVINTPEGPRSERGNHPVERRTLRQWMLRITAYAERLLRDLDLVDWPENIKEMQRNWIGRSQGAEVDFRTASGGTLTVFTTRPDTLFGATYMVLAPEHPLVASLTSEAQRKTVEAYVASSARKTDLERTDLARDKTGVFTGSYALNPVFDADDPRARIPIWVADYVLATYGTGAIMAVPAHDERDWEFAKKFGLEIIEVVVPDGATPAVGHPSQCFVGEGISANSGLISGLPTAQATARICDWLEARGSGRRRVNYKLRDWLFSRQLYWGEPFPILWREGAHMPANESDLPILPPDLDDFKPTPDGRPPLARAADWVQIDSRTTRETNVMPNWAGSCWYYLRYIDPKNDQAFTDPEKERYWMSGGGVDLYVGGAEHAVLHLLYARFWHKVLFDIGLVTTPEPFHRLVNQGIILGEDGQKMSKSRGNVINPDDVVAEFGADSFRLYEMFMGPLEQSKPWSTQGIKGVHAFLARVWRLFVREDDETGARRASPSLTDAAPSEDHLRLLHRTIRKVTDDIEGMRFNTAISALMVWVNETMKAASGGAPIPREVALSFVRLLSPFAPHVAEELWTILGRQPSIALQPWPEADPRHLRQDSIEIVVQINGKVRDRVTAPPDAPPDELEAAARALPKVAQALAGLRLIRVVTVPSRLVNFVVAPK
ncbi:MAG TPA: leucine--tRNA ligase [Verrucomicrobiae bacterium]|nr:leucine--tRNA ligase [Verrucomicrobiae bacterium]